MDVDVYEEGNMKKSFELILVFTQNLIQVTHVVTVRCWPSDVSLISTTSMFVVLSIDMVLIAFSTTLTKQKEKNLNSGACLQPYFPLRTEILNFLQFETLVHTLERVYLTTVLTGWVAEITL